VSDDDFLLCVCVILFFIGILSHRYIKYNKYIEFNTVAI
jgi:hypothetical protein